MPLYQEARTKVLVATSATQGKRQTDVDGCLDGEIVFPPKACATSRQDPYGPCACGRTFTGLETEGASTTAMVDDIVGYSRDEFLDAIYATESHGQGCLCVAGIERGVDSMLEQADRLPVGAIVERHLARLNVRLLRPR